jgi:hypothetical protein
MEHPKDTQKSALLGLCNRLGRPSRLLLAVRAGRSAEEPLDGGLESRLRDRFRLLLSRGWHGENLADRNGGPSDEVLDVAIHEIASIIRLYDSETDYSLEVVLEILEVIAALESSGRGSLARS